MLTYPVRLAPGEEVRVILTFPDVPEAVVVGASEEDVLRDAQPVLESVLADYVLKGRPIPRPSDICGAPLVATKRFSLVGLELE